METSVRQVLQTLVHLHCPQTVQQAKNVGNMASAKGMHATHYASHQTLHNLTPGSSAFHQDMCFYLPFLTDIVALQNTHQQFVDQWLLCENATHISHNYKVNGSILKRLSFHGQTN